MRVKAESYNNTTVNAFIRKLITEMPGGKYYIMSDIIIVLPKVYSIRFIDTKRDRKIIKQILTHGSFVKDVSGSVISTIETVYKHDIIVMNGDVDCFRGLCRKTRNGVIKPFDKYCGLIIPVTMQPELETSKIKNLLKRISGQMQYRVIACRPPDYNVDVIDMFRVKSADTLFNSRIDYTTGIVSLDDWG